MNLEQINSCRGLSDTTGLRGNLVSHITNRGIGGVMPRVTKRIVSTGYVRTTYPSTFVKTDLFNKVRLQ